MTKEISFYQLTKSRLDAVLPKLLERVLSDGLRAVVLADSEERVASLDALLWNYDQGSFMPHGTEADMADKDQPVFLTVNPQINPNGANILIATDASFLCDYNRFDRIIEIFDGNNPAELSAAKSCFNNLSNSGLSAIFWEQSANGSWRKILG